MCVCGCTFYSRTTCPTCELHRRQERNVATAPWSLVCTVFQRIPGTDLVVKPIGGLFQITLCVILLLLRVAQCQVTLVFPFTYWVVSLCSRYKSVLLLISYAVRKQILWLPDSPFLGIWNNFSVTSSDTFVFYLKFCSESWNFLYWNVLVTLLSFLVLGDLGYLLSTVVTSAFHQESFSVP